MAIAQDVTVVIPCYGHTDTVWRAAESALQAGEIIVVNDNDRHYTIPEWAERGENWRRIHEVNMPGLLPTGVCASRNAGIGRAKTTLILPFDADDYLLPGAVERMAAAWSPGKVIYGGWLERAYQHGTYPAVSGDPDWLYSFTPRRGNPPGMLSRKHVCHATYLFAKEDWQRVGGYDPDFNIGAEDWEFMIALVEAGCELVRLNDELYVKTIGENERTNKAIKRKDIIKQLLLEKHPDFFNNPR